MSNYLDEVINFLEKQMEFIKKTNGQLQLLGDAIKAELVKNKSIRDSMDESKGYKINAFDLPNGKFMFQVQYQNSPNITQEVFDTEKERDVRYNDLRKMMLCQELEMQNYYSGMLIDNLPLTIRTANAIKAQNIFNIKDLLNHTEKELLAFPNMGKKSFYEIKEELFNIGLKLKDSKQ